MNSSAAASASGKRKNDAAFPSDDDDDKMTTSKSNAAPATLLGTIPDVSWEAVAAFAAPPDVYHLCLSSAHFHTDPAAAADADGKKGSGGSSKSSGSAGTKKKKGSGGSKKKTKESRASKQPVLLATRLLRQSLLSSLGRVLDMSDSGITLQSALELANLPEGSAIIAGSTMAAAALGEVWSGAHSWNKQDVDIFCTAKAAPQVRSWLVQSAKSMFIGFKDYRLGMTDDSLLYTVDTKIHHVEHYGSQSENFTDRGEDLDVETLEEYVEATSEWGKDCQKNYVAWKWQNSMNFDVLGIEATNKAYAIKPDKGGSLPFDFDGKGNIDLVVAKVCDDNTKKATKKSGKSSKKQAKKSKSASEVTPFGILEDFDLTICKASFDGKTFRVPEPHLVFARKTTMEPYRRAVVESYLKHFPKIKGYEAPAAQSKIASATIKSVRKEVPDAPFYRLIDVAALVPDRYGDPDEDDVFALYNPMYQAKLGPPIQFHNWTKKLVDRLKKYQGRGIEVVEAPTVAEGVRLPHFSLTG